jgi:hypothetical protein
MGSKASKDTVSAISTTDLRESDHVYRRKTRDHGTVHIGIDGKLHVRWRCSSEYLGRPFFQVWTPCRVSYGATKRNSSSDALALVWQQ